MNPPVDDHNKEMLGMRKGIFILLASVLILFPAMADEGMWLLPLIQELNIKKMQAMGLQLTSDDLYSINHASLKDAVVALDYGICTAALVSADGLLLTNHHCGYDEIQAHSTVENDYLTDGFWAKSRQEELPNPGKSATFLIRMEDVTAAALEGVTADMDGDARERKIASNALIIENKATAGTNYDADVQSFFGGNQYYLIITQTFKDVRLVGAPPSSIGKFGDDTDNWMWPRHSGDFSIFRIYCAPDGSPADYSKDNVPYHPKHFLPVSIKGIEKNNFTLVMGYPGATTRYLSSAGVKELVEITHPDRIKIRGLKQHIWSEDMAADDKIRIQYSAKYYESSNYWKFSIGQLKGINRLNLYDRRKELEDTFSNWIDASDERKTTYGNALKWINDATMAEMPYEHAKQYLREALFNSIEAMVFCRSTGQLFRTMIETPDNKERIRSITEELRKNMYDFYKDYNANTDMKVAATMLELYYKNVPAEFHLSIFNLVKKKYKGDFNRFCKDMYSRSVFPDSTKYKAFLNKPSLKVLKKDLIFALAISFEQMYFDIDPKIERFEGIREKGERLFIKGLMEMQKDTIFYPDANSTLRLSYGRVSDYKPMDAVHYDYITTLTGIMEKEDPNNWEFIVPDRLNELYRTKDYGRYGKNGLMPVCFITNNDITGGNSGSPVMNARGELIGLAFDGNWEAMTGDIAYEPTLQKCICVDIRYVLFVIDKYAGAKNLVDEMTIVQ